MIYFLKANNFGPLFATFAFLVCFNLQPSLEELILDTEDSLIQYPTLWHFTRLDYKENLPAVECISEVPETVNTGFWSNCGTLSRFAKLDINLFVVEDEGLGNPDFIIIRGLFVSSDDSPVNMTLTISGVFNGDHSFNISSDSSNLVETEIDLKTLLVPVFPNSTISLHQIIGTAVFDKITVNFTEDTPTTSTTMTTESSTTTDTDLTSSASTATTTLSSTLSTTSDAEITTITTKDTTTMFYSSTEAASTTEFTTEPETAPKEQRNLSDVEITLIVIGGVGVVVLAVFLCCVFIQRSNKRKLLENDDSAETATNDGTIFGEASVFAKSPYASNVALHQSPSKPPSEYYLANKQVISPYARNALYTGERIEPTILPRLTSVPRNY